MWIRRLLGALLAFGALNAFAGGYCGLSGAEGVPRKWLAGSPFTLVLTSLLPSTAARKRTGY